MTRISATLALALIVCATASAATFPTTLTVNAKGAIGADFSSFAITGTANFAGPIGNGTLTATIPASALATDPVKTAFKIALAGVDTLTGTLSVPQATILGNATSPSATLTVTGGTGTYTTAAGSFTLAGTVSGGLTTGFTLTNFTGSGTITTGGTGTGGGGTGAGPTPIVTAVLDSASNTANVAQGSIFIVKGSSLCPSGIKFFDLPRPTAAPDGVKITFTPVSGGTGTDSILVYEYNPSGVCQLAAILPSTLAVGTYNVTVTNGSASLPFGAQVVARKPTLFTQDSTGAGLGAVQNFISQSTVDYNGFTTGVARGVTVSPAHPGQVLIAYATGLGALAGSDNIANPAFDFNANGVAVRAIVGGVSIPVSYAGRAGYAGQDQINFALPANVPTGCAVPFQISANGILSQTTFIAIAPDANSSVCVMPGFTSDQLKKFDNGGTYTVGAFSITQFTITLPTVGTVKSNTIGGGFSQYTGFQLASAAQGNVSVIQSGSCQVIQATSTGTATATAGTLNYLDAGTVTINGPAGSSLTNLPLTKTNNIYSLSSFEGLSVPIPGQTNFSLLPGTYTLNGAGGNDVGSFNTSITLASPLTLTGELPSTVNRSAALTLNWTGGNASDVVEIVGSSVTTTGAGSSAVVNSSTFLCLTTAGQKTFTVPASILSQLPATTGTDTGIIELASGNFSNTFSASLKAGGSIDSGLFVNFLGVGGTVTFQ